MNSSLIKTATDVIDRLGGTVAVAKLMGTDPRAVSNWRVRGLPPETFHAMDGLLRAKGLHAPPALWRQREAAGE
jgi:hypothetical protein